MLLSIINYIAKPPMLPILRILLIEQDPITLKELSTNLSKTIPNFERDDIHIDIVERLELKHALESVEEDGDIQSKLFPTGEIELPLKFAKPSIRMPDFIFLRSINTFFSLNRLVLLQFQSRRLINV